MAVSLFPKRSENHVPIPVFLDMLAQWVPTI
jgi:hypothetical protein